MKINRTIGRRNFLLSLAGIAPGLVLLSPQNLKASEKLKDIIQTVEADSIIKSKPVKNREITSKNSTSGMTILYRKNESRPVCTMNKMGKFIWDMCNGNHTLSNIAEKIQREYAVSFEHSYADCIKFINNLNKIGAIQL